MTSVTITVTFDKPTVYGGFYYGGVLIKDTELLSVNQVVVASTPVQYLAGATSVVATIRGLSAVTDYDLYSYVLSDAGYGLSLDATITTVRAFTTSCCKTIAFSNAPSSVYGDVLDKYTTSTPSTYVFSYALTAAPRGWVSVTPSFKVNNVATSAVVAVPASKTFESGTIALTGSFYLTAAPTYGEIVTMTLTVVTESGNPEYFDVPANIVQILNSQSPIPAPKLLSSQFSDAGNFVYIYLDSASDGAVSAVVNAIPATTTTWPCSNVFAFVGDSTTTCSWLNAFTVRASFATYDGSANFLMVGSSVTLKDEKIKAQCTAGSDCSKNEFSIGSNVPVTVSSNPVVPGPVLLVPQTISSCTALTVDATLSTGSGGRYWSAVEWTVTAFSGSNEVYPDDMMLILQGFGQNINRLISVPTSVLQEATYTINLALTNFLGQKSSVSTTFEVNGNKNLPTLSIVGSSLLTVNPSQPVILYSNAVLTTCSTSKTIVYSWNVFEAGGQSSGIVSSSLDPKVLMVAAYQLIAGKVYQAQVTALVNADGVDTIAVSQATILVGNGPVVATVKGGYNRAVFIVSTPLVLDASISTDSNLKATDAQGLSYAWSCIITSTVNYGTDCSSIFGSQSVVAATISLSGDLVQYGVTYGVGITVRSNDGRTDRKVVSVQNLYERITSSPGGLSTGAPTYVGAVAYISSTYTKFNADSQVSIFGYVQANYALTATWSATVSGQNTVFTSLTDQSKTFTAAEATSQISFPLAIPGGTFVPGSQVTFRIGANMKDATSLALYSYSEIVLNVNSPPSGGVVTSDPKTGEPLTSSFALLSASWVDDPSDYPLTFDFVYSLSSTSVANTIKARSTSSSASTNLPAGLDASSNVIVITGRVYDSLLAVSSSDVSVTVVATEVQTAGGIATYAAKALEDALASGDLDGTMQVMNNVANSLNAVNCTGASVAHCASLFRSSCDSVDRTCGACIDNYVGIAGPANTKCFAQTRRRLIAGDGTVDAACDVNGDCIYGLCTSNKCAVPTKTCPSASGDVCSGHGTCKYFDSSGNAGNAACLITDTHCTASCACATGFGGSDCSLTASETASKDATRTSICESLLQVASTTNPSTNALVSMLSTLSVTYSPTEVVSAEGTALCQAALTKVSQMAAAGYLAGATAGTIDTLIATASRFVTYSTASNDGSVVSNAVSNIIEGVYYTMVNGQAPVNVVSDNIRATVLRSPVSSLVNAKITPPATTEETAYGAKLPSFTFVGSSAAKCNTGSGYVQLALLSWGNNPFPGSSGVNTNVLRLESSTATPARRLSTTSRTEELDFTPTYNVTMAFNAKQTFDFTADPDDKVLIGSTLRFPKCKTYVGGVYVDCENCHVASYTNFEVTYACSAITDVCGTEGARRLNTFDSSENIVLSNRRLQDEVQTGSSRVSQFATMNGNTEMDPPSAAPSAVPSLAPSAAPSQAPSAAPSAAPSVTSTSLSVSPTLAPSAVPSVAPSALPNNASPTRRPTEGTPNQEISFDTSLNLRDVTEAPLTSASQLSIAQAVAQVMNLTASHVTFKSQRIVTFARRQLATGLFEVQAVVNTKVDTDEFASDFSEDATVIYNMLTTKLTAAVSGGDLKRAIQTQSIANGATGTSTIGDVEATIAPLDNVDSDNNDDKPISDGGIAGIVIAVFFVSIMLVAAGYFAYTRSTSASPPGRPLSESKAASVDHFDQVNSKDNSRPASQNNLNQMVSLNSMEDGGSTGKPGEITLDMSGKNPAGEQIIVVVEQNALG
jgi:hypothetical protein